MDHIALLRMTAKIVSLIAGGFAVCFLFIAVQAWQTPKRFDLLLDAAMTGGTAMLLIYCARALPSLPTKRGKTIRDRILNWADDL